MKLRARILVSSIGLATIGIVLAGVLASVLIKGSLEEQIAKREENHLGLVSSILTDSAIAFPPTVRTHRLLSHIARDLNVRFTLIRNDGVVLFDSEVMTDSLPNLDNHSSRPEIIGARNGKTGFDRRKSSSVGEQFAYAASRITHPSLGSLDSGFVRVALPMDEIDRVATQLLTIVIGSAGIAAMIMIIVSSFVSKKLSAPILSIVKTVDRIRNGDLRARITEQYPSEVGELAAAVNNMTEKLASDKATLEKLERVRSEFLGNVSHELRTPIFSLQGFLETLLDGALDDPTVNRSFLEKAHRHAERLSTLLNDLIEISRIESGEMKMSFRYVPAVEFLESIMEEIKPVADNKNIAFSLALEFDRSAKVYADKARLRQVMINLIDNALKYTEPGGHVVCRARPIRNQCEILVEDTGCGIPDEHLSRIFERFYRVDKDRSREVGGTGLGLAIAKHIVEAHGGLLTVRSKAGEGSTFSFTLKR